MRIPVICLLGILCLVPAPGCSKSPSAMAKLGDPAAPLDGLTYLKGGPVKIEPGKLVVVEFWATWCPPCRESIPHLTKVAAQYKDKGVQVLGISVEDDESVVQSFVNDQGDKMNYVVAVDPGKKVREGYMTAFGERYIPHAFLVDKAGKVVWRGTPFDGLESAINKALSAK